MHQEQKIGSWTLAAAVTTLLTAQLFHPILLFPVQTIGTATWLAVLLAGGLALVLYWPVAAVLRALGKGNLIDLAGVAAGVPGEIALAVVLCAFLVVHSAFVLRETAEMALSAAYPHTPQTFAMVTLSLCFLYGAWGGTTALIRLGRLFLPALVLAVLAVVTGSMSWGEPIFVLPLWGRGPSVVLGSMGSLLSLYAPILFLLLAAGQLRDRQHLVRGGAVALGGFALLLAAATLVFLITFPLPLGHSVTFPLHAMSRLMLGGRFFERMDGIWMCTWVFGTAVHLSALVHIAALAYGRAFGFPDHRPAVLPLGAIVITIALFPPDQGRVLVWHSLAAPFTAGAAFGLPLALAVLAWWRRRGVSA